MPSRSMQHRRGVAKATVSSRLQAAHAQLEGAVEALRRVRGTKDAPASWNAQCFEKARGDLERAAREVQRLPRTLRSDLPLPRIGSPNERAAEGALGGRSLEKARALELVLELERVLRMLRKKRVPAEHLPQVDGASRQGWGTNEQAYAFGEAAFDASWSSRQTATVWWAITGFLMTFATVLHALQ